MRIDDANLSGLTSSQVSRTNETAPATRAPAKEGGPGKAGSDSVQLSSLAGAVAYQGEQPERTGRVERLAADFQSGRLQADAAATSQAIVNDALTNRLY